MIACSLFGSVQVRQHQDDTGHACGGPRIDRSDATLADRRLDNEAVGGGRPLRDFEGVAGAACHFQSSVDPVERLADDALRADVERRGPDGSVHFHGTCSFRRG
jgi:hypothetical protein